MTRARCTFAPPYLLRRLAETDPAAARTLELDERFRAARGRRARGGRPVRTLNVREQDLTDDLRRIADLVLRAQES